MPQTSSTSNWVQGMKGRETNVPLLPNTTGAGTPLLGVNSPAIDNTTPYTWFTMISDDGSTVYIPAWK
jgi:hypothetical protein